MKDKIEDPILHQIKRAIWMEYNVKIYNLEIDIQLNSDLGDYTFKCFQVTKELNDTPINIAKNINRYILIRGVIIKVESNGPYINIFIDKGILFKEVCEIYKKL